MRKSTRWVANLALAAAIPASALAGPFDFLRGSEPAPVAGNQEAAEQVANALRAAKLQGRDVEIEFDNGIVILTGTIADAGQKARATQAASHVAGVRSVDNRMQVANTTAGQPAPRNAVEQVSNEVDANPFDAPRAMPAPPRGPSQFTESAERFETPVGPSNQEMAQRIAGALSQQQLQGYDIEIRFENGIAALGGSVTSRSQWEMASRTAGNVPGVQRVINRMRVEAPQPATQTPLQTAAAPQRAMQAPVQQASRGPVQPGMRAPIQQVNYRQEPPLPGDPGLAPGPVPGVVPPGPPPGWMPPHVPNAPQPYGHPGAGTGHQAYSMPNMPEYAWPAQAAYPNSAQISYPQMYSASAFPYIGPFYPYPQVPLGWREAQLEWDDGYWHLNFKPRTSKWFWFVNPRNWD
jgi:hypothetical protein